MLGFNRYLFIYSYVLVMLYSSAFKSNWLWYSSWRAHVVCQGNIYSVCTWRRYYITPPKISAAIGQRNIIIICAPLRVTLFAWNIKSLFFGFRRGLGVNICGNLWLLLSVVCDKFHWVIMGGFNNNFEIDCTIVQYIKKFCGISTNEDDTVMNLPSAMKGVKQRWA